MGTRGYSRNRYVAALTAGSLLAGGFVLGGIPGGVAPAAAAVTPAPNPLIADSCGIDVSIVLDASGSVSSSGAVDDVRDAADTFLQSLKNTNSYARVGQFASVAQTLATRTQVDDASMGQGGSLANAVQAYYNPIPPRPSGVNIYRYDGSGNPQSSSNFTLSNSSNQYTNWDQSLDLAGSTGINPPDLVVYITDGDPTAYDFNQPGDPFDPGPPPDVAMNTDRDQAKQVTIDRAVEEANQIKAGLFKSRMLAIGVGSAINNSSSQERLKQISGPQLVTDLTTVDSLNEVDVAAVRDFDDLAQFLREVVLELCSPSLTIRKLAQSPNSAEYLPAPGWDMTVTPTVSGGFGWILPDTAPAVSKTDATDANGFSQFQWEPTVPGTLSSAKVQEALQQGYIQGRPGEDDWRCELKDVDGNVRTVSGELDPQGSFTLPDIGEEIVTCTVWNSYDYKPAIALAKVNAPTELRGDLDPPAEVTSTYTVTNPGNTPLDNIVLTDDKCGPVVETPAGGPNVGDTDKDGLLDPGEEWKYTCSRGISTPLSTSPKNILNIAKVNATDPVGTRVSAKAQDDVDAYTPAISLTKTVDQTSVPSGTEVTYDYVVKNLGSTPLEPVTLDDVSTPDTGCADPTFVDGDTDGDDALDLSETWTYTCTATITEETINEATVEGTPVNPRTGTVFPDPNPTVTDVDTAEVVVIDPDLVLTKIVDKPVVFPGTEVTYTYTATNTGNTDLREADPAGWITDDTCSSVDYVTGDDGDGLLNAGDPGETWEFSCTSTIEEDTLNTAEIVAQPVDGEGTDIGGPLTRTAQALVQVVAPGIDLVKTALKPIVYDPNTDLDSGLVGTTDPALYQYDVTNTGDVPLKAVKLTDDKCSPLVFDPATDTNGDTNLDVTEVWTYTCSKPLERQQGTPPATGAESAQVINNAEVTGTPFLPSDPDQTTADVSAKDRAAVLVIEPAIAIEKSVAPEVVRVGGEVTYTFKVMNKGDVGLDVVGPTDDKCAPLTYVGGDLDGNGLLDGANARAVETWEYTCSRDIGYPEPPAEIDLNTATVRGIDPLGGTVSDEDTAEVRVIDPAINLEKTVSDSLVPSGTEVSYEFLVTNVGTSPAAVDDVLAEVTLVDVAKPKQPSCASPTLVAKEGGNDDDLLDRDPAETWRYSCASTITEPTTNVAVVGALGGTNNKLELPVFDIAAAYVGTFNPAIDVVKSATPTVIFDSGPVTYTYTVKNTGDVPLAGVKDRITDNTCSPVTYVSGDEDGDGLLDTPNSIFEDSLDETWTFTCTTTVSTTTTNTVATPGTPVDPGGEPLCRPTPVPVRGLQAAALPASCDVTDSAKAVVTVVKPASITIIKKTDPVTAEIFPFTFGSEAFGLTSGGSKTFTGLKPGTYETREQVLDGWELVGLACTDPTGDTRVSVGTGLATINVGSGESVTCTYTNQQEVTEPTEVLPPDGTEGGTEDTPELADTGGGFLPALLVALLGVVLIGTGMRLSSNRR